MKAEIEIEFRGKWINLPVDYNYSAMGDKATVDIVTVGTQDILEVLDTFERDYLQSLAQKDWDHHQECRRRSMAARADSLQRMAAEIQQERLSDPLALNRRHG